MYLNTGLCVGVCVCLCGCVERQGKQDKIKEERGGKVTE